MTEHFAADNPIKVGDGGVSAPGDFGGAALVFGRVAVGDVVGAGQVVVWQGGEVERTIVAVVFTVASNRTGHWKKR